MRSLAVLLLAACGSSTPAPKPRPLPPPPYTGHVDVRARVDATSLDTSVMSNVEDRCLAATEIQRRTDALAAARETALVAALSAADLKPVTLESAVDRREGAGPMSADEESTVQLHQPWTEIDRDGARWLVGPSDDVSCGLDQPAFGEPRFVISSAGEVRRLDVRVIRTHDVYVRACPAACPTGSSMCGAHMPATLQIRWKLPPNARFTGHLIAGIEGPVLDAPADPRPTPCPVIQPPP